MHAHRTYIRYLIHARCEKRDCELHLDSLGLLSDKITYERRLALLTNLRKRTRVRIRNALQR